MYCIDFKNFRQKRSTANNYLELVIYFIQFNLKNNILSEI